MVILPPLRNQKVTFSITRETWLTAFISLSLSSECNIDSVPSLVVGVNADIDGYLNWSKPQRNVE